MFAREVQSLVGENVHSLSSSQKIQWIRNKSLNLPPLQPTSPGFFFLSSLSIISILVSSADAFQVLILLSAWQYWKQCIFVSSHSLAEISTAQAILQPLPSYPTTTHKCSSEFSLGSSSHFTPCSLPEQPHSLS